MDFLEEKKKEIHSRLTELRPMVDEYHRLEEAQRALSGVNGTVESKPVSSPVSNDPFAPAPATPKRRGRPVGRKNKAAGATGTLRRGRPRGSGTRANQALELVRSRPGISIPELAEAMGIKQNYLYRVMPTLAEQKLIKKSGRGWAAKAA